MKKHCLKIKALGVALAALLAGGVASSCAREAVIDSVVTDTEYFTVTNDMWEVDDKGDFVFSFNWKAITTDVINNGNVDAYHLEIQNGAEHQNPLPYIYAIDHVDVNGNPIYEPINIRFDVEPEWITFVVSDVATYLTLRTQLPTMRFRAVVSKPVTYIIEQ